MLTGAGGVLVGSGSLLLGAVGLSSDLGPESIPSEVPIFGFAASDLGIAIASEGAARSPFLIAPAVSGGRADGVESVSESISGDPPVTQASTGVAAGEQSPPPVTISSDPGPSAGSENKARASVEVLPPKMPPGSAIREFISTLPPAARIRIPEIDLDVDVVTVNVDSQNRVETPAFAVGRFAGGGQVGLPGNVILSGHNDIDGAVFGKLPEVGDGAEVLLRRGDYDFVYVAHFAVKVWESGAPPATRLENARFLLPTVSAITTLITCYPPWVDTHRWIVRASLLEMRDLASGWGPGVDGFR